MKDFSALQRAMRRLGIEIGRSHYTTRSRRAQLLNAHGVDLLVDVGANRGQYVRAVRSAGYSGRVISFEPAADPYDGLVSACAADETWSCRRFAIGAAPGFADLQVSTNDYFNSILPTSQVTISNDARAEAIGTERVEVRTLDELLHAEQGERLAIKADVQGFESEVIAGANNTLKRSTVVELELSPAEIYAGQQLMIPMLQTMQDNGFVLALVENALMEESTGGALQFNGIFVRRGPSRLA
ncbi:FkbM family methyltransferase [Ilumatobacter sp.]|uniref:FkbM family methyltransferase n=1 Tax=Ilumatobacter sp. TaxID=1967498 RepID=UPI003752DB3E